MYLADPAFLEELRKLRRQAVDHAVGLLQKAAGRAVAALVRNMSCGKPAAEVRAATVVLDKAIAADLEARLAALEARLEDKQ